jgi:hypothetical protein
LLKGYDNAVDAVVDVLCALPPDLRQEAIIAACTDDDWSCFNELLMWEVTKGGTKSEEIFLNRVDGTVKISLIPERVGRKT